MAAIALVLLQGADEVLVAAREPSGRPLVVRSQPAQDTLVQL